jgi:hypothetical protein
MRGHAQSAEDSASLGTSWLLPYGLVSVKSPSAFLGECSPFSA